MEVLTGLPQLDLVIQSEVRSATHHLWSMGCWSYLHPSQGHGSILKWIQKSDPIFNIGVDVMRSVFDLEPKYRVTVLTREEWTRVPRLLPRSKGSSGLRRGPGLRRWSRAGGLWAICRKKAQHLSRKACYSLSG
jgi:hypothetical protein